MFIDVVFSSGNEEEFVAKAKTLGTSGLIFVYDKDEKSNLEIVKRLNSKNFPVFSALVVDNKFSSKYDFLFSKGSRNHFESKKTNIVFDLEETFKTDNLHFRNSGLNQVLSSLAHENKIFIGFDFSLLLNANKKGVILGRMIQNVSLCKKYKVKMLIASFARKPSEMRFWKDLISFGVTLSLSLKESKEAIFNRKI